MWRLALAALIALTTLGCAKGTDSTSSTPSIAGVDFTNSKCTAIVIFPGGGVSSITGDNGSSVTQGGFTFTFAPDCSKVETTTTTAHAELPHVQSVTVAP